MRLGCLAILMLWAILGICLHFMDGFGEAGGGRFAGIGLVGLIVLIIGSALASLKSSRRREPRGFPIEPKRPDDAA